MAVQIVDRLEAVDVDDRQMRAFVPACALDAPIECRVQSETVVQTGQCISTARAGQVQILLFEFALVLLELQFVPVARAKVMAQLAYALRSCMRATTWRDNPCIASIWTGASVRGSRSMRHSVPTALQAGVAALWPVPCLSSRATPEAQSSQSTSRAPGNSTRCANWASVKRRALTGARRCHWREWSRCGRGVVAMGGIEPPTLAL